MASKCGWARVVGREGGYGRWIPTGCTDKVGAADYIETYLLGEGWRVKEWIQL